MTTDFKNKEPLHMQIVDGTAYPYEVKKNWLKSITTDLAEICLFRILMQNLMIQLSDILLHMENFLLLWRMMRFLEWLPITGLPQNAVKWNGFTLRQMPEADILERGWQRLLLSMQKPQVIVFSVFLPQKFFHYIMIM